MSLINELDNHIFEVRNNSKTVSREIHIVVMFKNENQKTEL